MTCKFCKAAEGSIGRTNKPVHINRDQLCGPCASLFDKLRYTPDKIAPAELSWFKKVVVYNKETGAYVPRRFQDEPQRESWRCAGCGQRIQRDQHYVNYCVFCAAAIRSNRRMPSSDKRKKRSDTGKPHRRG